MPVEPFPGRLSTEVQGHSRSPSAARFSTTSSNTKHRRTGLRVAESTMNVYGYRLPADHERAAGQEPQSMYTHTHESRRTERPWFRMAPNPLQQERCLLKPI